MDNKIIEIKGVKLEVDMRTAKNIETYKVGDLVKVLIKKYNDYESKPGCIIGFDDFKNLPTIVVLYLDTSTYSSGQILNFVYVNTQNKDVEICPANPDDLSFEKTSVLDRFDREVEKLEEQTRELKNKRNYFEKMYHRHFGNK